jgi:hypothetical protein
VKTPLREIAPDQSEVLRALARGERIADLAGRTGRSTDEVDRLALRGMDAIAGEAPQGVGRAERAAIGAYLLGRQPPGQAEATWQLLRSSAEAARWAQRLRDALSDVLADGSPPLPADDGARSPAERFRGRAPQPPGGEPTLRQRREQRDRERTARNAQQAATEIASPYRSEAVEAYQESEDRIELPRWAPRPVQLSIYAVLTAVLVALAFCIFVRIPVNTNALVLVTDIPRGAPGAGPGGLQVVALFAQDNGQSKDTGSGKDVREGDVLRVALPGERNRTPMTLRWVSDGPLAARTVIDAYRLPLGQANRVVAPGHVALARLRTPAGRGARSFEGTTTTEASVQTGSRRIISLLF